MTPAARIQAAIELLTDIERAESPADHCVSAYFRSRRYAGGGDRRAVSERVYGILRRRGLLTWRLGAAAPTPRLLVLADLALADGLTSASLAPLLTGADYAPAPLDAAESAFLDRLTAPAGTAPDWAEANLPPWLEAALRRRFADDLLLEMRAFEQRAPVDLRVNRLRMEPETALARLAAEGFEAEAGRWSPLCLRLHGRADLRASELYRQGAIEPQDEASQIAALLVAAEPGQQVIDYCAGAGGKSLALAAEMANRGQIYALDVSARRLAQMDPRLQRAGVRNVQTRTLDREAGPWLAELEGRMDRVLVDAPCSGSGAWRRNPAARWQLDHARLEVLTRRQREIMARAARLVRPGGRLIYSVCSLLVAEAEDVVAALLGAQPEFRPLPVAEVWRGFGAAASPVREDSPWLLLTPARHGTDGFFIAVLERDASPLVTGPAGTV